MGEDSRDGRTPAVEAARELSGTQFIRAADRGELRAFMIAAVRRGRWDLATQLLAFARRPSLALDHVGEVVEAIQNGLEQVPEARRARVLASDEARALMLEAGETLRGRLRQDPLPPHDRRWLAVAARAFALAQDHWRAGETFERAGAFSEAAESWAALGEIEAMERALGRAEAEREASRGPALLFRDARSALTHGERRRALALLAKLPAEHPHAAEARRLTHEISSRLVRGGQLGLRAENGDIQRFACTPVTLGRDPTAGLSFRDPSISRQHARIAWRPEEGRFWLEDLGSRTGTRVGPAAVTAPLALGDTGTFTLGPSCVMGYDVVGHGVLRLNVLGGFDRGTVALLGPERLPLAAGRLAGFAALGDAEIAVAFDNGQARWLSPPSIRTWLGADPADPAIDLLHGDRLRAERVTPPESSLACEVL
jgi:hypothetical protein